MVFGVYDAAAYAVLSSAASRGETKRLAAEHLAANQLAAKRQRLAAKRQRLAAKRQRLAVKRLARSFSCVGSWYKLRRSAIQAPCVRTRVFVSV